MKKPETALEKFRTQEQAINADVDLAEKHWNAVLSKQEKIQADAEAAADKERLVLERMTADFEKIEAELEAEELRRLDSAGLTKAALADGRIGADAYFKQGVTDAEAVKRAQAVASEKLADLRSAIRAKAIKVIELEEQELRAEWECWCASTFPAATMAERLKGLLKALEASLSSGIGGGPLVKTRLDAKARELRNATKGHIPGDGEGWRDFDLAGLKRLRLNPTWPVDQLPKLEEIIAEAKTTGRACRLMLDFRQPKNPVNVMWS